MLLMMQFTLLSTVFLLPIALAGSVVLAIVYFENCSSMLIPLFYDADKLNMGLGGPASLIAWDPQRCPSLVFIGRSGTGKSTAAQIALGRVKRYAKGPGARATICDFKSEYTYLKGCPRHFDHNRCIDGLTSFAAENERRICEGVTDADPLHALLFSEWGMFCSISDKRTRDEAISTVAGLIMSVRAQRMSVWLDLQRPDSQFMGTARDSLAPIALGNLSPEGKRMAFPDYVDMLEPVGANEGYFSDGVNPPRKIIIPTVTKWDILRKDVKALVE